MLAGVLLAGMGCADRDNDPFAVGFVSPTPSGASGSARPTPCSALEPARATVAPAGTGACARARQAGSVAVRTYVQQPQPRLDERCPR